MTSRIADDRATYSASHSPGVHLRRGVVKIKVFKKRGSEFESLKGIKTPIKRGAPNKARKKVPNKCTKKYNKYVRKPNRLYNTKNNVQ